jgi:hypothetical protein
MHTACWIPESTISHLECLILLFHCNYCYLNALQCFVKRTFPLLFDYAISDEKLPSDFSYIFLSTVCSSLRCPVASYSSSCVEAVLCCVVCCGMTHAATDILPAPRLCMLKFGRNRSVCRKSVLSSVGLEC